MSGCLVLFTDRFPYGTDETFLTPEIDHLSNYFDRILLVPSFKGTPTRSLPANVEVVDVLIEPKPEKTFRVILEHIDKVVRIYLWTMFQNGNAYPYFKYYKSFLHYLALDLRKYQSLKRFIKKEQLQKAIFYDYWFVNSTISLVELKKEKLVQKIVCRAHGFDLYDERQFEGKVSFRDYKINHLDSVFVVSRLGVHYLRSKVPSKFHHKIKCAYLGVDEWTKEDIVPSKSPQDLTVVSCARIIPLKRIEMIPRLLSQLDRSVRWVHFGDGQHLASIQDLSSTFTNLTVEMKGPVQNQEIRQFYAQNQVDFFISLSLSEGIPVSMMESISHGIPIFATDVGGVNEVVNVTTGMLIAPKSSMPEITQALHQFIGNLPDFSPEDIVQFYRKHFSADYNYCTFAKQLNSTLEAS